jgi:hypothetical protein
MRQKENDVATKTQATIQILLDIPNVEVVRTDVHFDSKLLIWVESQVENGSFAHFLR